jgi:oligosaccharyltransferase complex subunit alpha (ribophorin I)
VGALLEGEFGRVDYDGYGRVGGKNAIRELRAGLPLKSSNLWYGDEIGNVSTSHAAREWDDVRLDLEPRFPILGGWKSNFNIGYILPSKFQIFTDEKSQNSVNLTFALPFKDIMARNYTLSVILPEGASDIKVTLNVNL